MRAVLLLQALLLLALLVPPAPAAGGGGPSPWPLRDLGPRLERLRREAGLPAVGAVVLRDGEVFALGASGRRRQGDPTPVLASDPWHLGSCGKAVTATALAVLVERGLPEDRPLRWDLTLAEGLPELAEAMDPAFRKVTLEDLLHHRGGLGDPPPDLWRELRKRQGTPLEQRRRLAEALLQAPPAVEPGRYRYANAGYSLAGHLAETALGLPWEELLRRHLLEPLGMEGAGFGVPWTGEPPRGPWPHDASGRPLVPGPFADNPPALAPAGTLHLPLLAWGRFAAAHLNGEAGEAPLLAAGTWRRLHEPAPAAEGEPAYAAGWAVLERPWARGEGGRGRVLQHAGSNRSWFAVAWLAPEIRGGILAVTNQGEGDTARRLDRVVAGLLPLLQQEPEAREPVSLGVVAPFLEAPPAEAGGRAAKAAAPPAETEEPAGTAEALRAGTEEPAGTAAGRAPQADGAAGEEDAGGPPPEGVLDRGGLRFLLLPTDPAAAEEALLRELGRSPWPLVLVEAPAPAGAGEAADPLAAATRLRRRVRSLDPGRVLAWIQPGTGGLLVRDGLPLLQTVAGEAAAWSLDLDARLLRGPAGAAFALPEPGARRYRSLRVRGFAVHLESALDAETALREEVLALLAAKLREIETALPPAAVERLREVPLWFHLERPAAPGGVYHPSLAWLRSHEGHDGRWARGVEFGVARNFLDWMRTQPSMVLHELAHAWHDQVLGYGDESLRRAFERAREAGLYDEVLHVEGGRKRHYALNNPQEFFAEMSEALYGVNDFFPFVRAELRETDPATAQAVEEAWRRRP